jgi:TnpA family transposase
MLRKLAACRRRNQLDLALQELGRIERTLFMLDWFESPELRRCCHAGLNKSKQRHFLAQVISTFKQGRQTRPDCRPQCRGAAVSCLRPHDNSEKFR